MLYHSNLCQSESAFHHVKAGPDEHPVKKKQKAGMATDVSGA
jgi:hypothetical protein